MKIYDDSTVSYDDIRVTYDGADFSPNFQGNIKPQIDKIDRTRSVFTSSLVTYNQAGLTYNDSSTYYGGSDQKQGDIAQNTDIRNIKPQSI